MSAGKQNTQTPAIKPMERERDLYFRRLTWVASQQIDSQTPIGQHHNNSYDSESGSEPDSKPTTESTSSSGRERTRKALQSFANLLTLHAKIVAAVSGGNRLAVLEEAQKSVDKGGGTSKPGKIVVSRNPRWSVDTMKGGPSGTEEDFAWYNGQLGIRSITVGPDSAFRPPISPDRPFSHHLQTLLGLLETKSNSPVEAFVPVLKAQVYMIRTCFLKIATRASDHCPIMQPREDLPSQSKIYKGKTKVKAEGSRSTELKSEAAGIMIPDGSAKAGGSSTIKPTRRVKGFDFGAILLPTKTTLSATTSSIISDLLASEIRWKKIHSLSVEKLVEVAKDLETSVFNHTLNLRISESNQCRIALEFTSKHLGTAEPSACKTYGQLHQMFSALLLCFFSGLKTLFAISSAPRQADAWQTFISTDAKDLSDGMWRALCIIVLSGAHLNSLVRPGDVDPIFQSYLDILFDQEHALGCLKWLQTTTEHYTSITYLRQSDIQPRISKIRVSIIDIRFAEGGRDDSMLDLDKFFKDVPTTRLKAKHNLTPNDKIRLAKDVRARRGNHAGLTRFNGTMHAETILLLLVLMVRTDEYKHLVPPNMVDTMKQINPTILAVSKRCCPVCSVVVKLTETKLNINIEHSGSHPTYSACCLPPWTPADIADYIIRKVEAKVVPMLQARANVLRGELRATRGSGTPQPVDRKTLIDETSMPTGDLLDFAMQNAQKR